MKRIRLILVLLLCAVLAALTGCANTSGAFVGDTGADFTVNQNPNPTPIIPSNPPKPPNDPYYDPTKPNNGYPPYYIPERYNSISPTNVYPTNAVLQPYLYSLYEDGKRVKYFSPIDISIIGIVITDDPQRWTTEETFRPSMWEEWPELFAEYFPDPHCYAFITFKVTNTSQEVAKTMRLSGEPPSNGFFMIDNNYRVRIITNISGSAGYVSHGGGRMDAGMFSRHLLELQPGETREVTLGYWLDGRNRLIDDTAQWRFFYCMNNGASLNLDPMSGFGWVIDDSFVTYEWSKE